MIAFLGLIVLVRTPELKGQGLRRDCRPVLPEVSQIPSATGRRRLEQFVWNIVQQRRQFILSEQAAHQAPPSLSDTRIPEDLSSLVTPIEIASIFAQFYRGNGGPVGTAYSMVASELYAAWLLPLEPARQVLLDRQVPAFGRLHAYMSITRYGGSPEALEDAGSILCELAAKAAGVMALLAPEPIGGDAVNYLAPYLDIDEQRLAVAIAQSLFHVSNPRSFINSVIESVGADNPVAVFLQRYAQSRGIP